MDDSYNFIGEISRINGKVGNLETKLNDFERNFRELSRMLYGAVQPPYPPGINSNTLYQSISNIYTFITNYKLQNIFIYNLIKNRDNYDINIETEEQFKDFLDEIKEIFGTNKIDFDFNEMNSCLNNIGYFLYNIDYFRIIYKDKQIICKFEDWVDCILFMRYAAINRESSTLLNHMNIFANKEKLIAKIRKLIFDKEMDGTSDKVIYE